MEQLDIPNVRYPGHVRYPREVRYIPEILDILDKLYFLYRVQVSDPEDDISQTR